MSNINTFFTEMNKHLLEDQNPSKYLEECSTSPVFQVHPFNMLLKLKKTEQEPTHHPEGNAWIHTMLVVDQAALRRSESNHVESFMWAALLHDIGKPDATKLRHGRITAYDHDKIGEKQAKEFLLALGASRAFTSEVSALVRYHMHILFVVKNMPYSDIKGLNRRTDIHEIALLGLCDRLGRTGANITKEQENIRLFLSKIESRKEREVKKYGKGRHEETRSEGTPRHREQSQITFSEK